MGTVPIAIDPFSPIFITAPVPNCFSMVARLSSRAFCLSLFCSTWRLLCVRLVSIWGDAVDPTQGV